MSDDKCPACGNPPWRRFASTATSRRRRHRIPMPKKYQQAIRQPRPSWRKTWIGRTVIVCSHPCHDVPQSEPRTWWRKPVEPWTPPEQAVPARVHHPDLTEMNHRTKRALQGKHRR